MRRVSTGLIVVVLLAVSSSTEAAYHYIRGGAIGNGSGSDWNNAMPNMPATFVRGDVYYVADGIYQCKPLNTPLSGTSTITIRKATITDHGTSTGWRNEFGDGEALFNTGIIFYTGYWVIDGVTGGGPNQWERNYGFRVAFDSIGNYNHLVFRANGSNNVIRHVVLGYPFAPGAGCSQAAYSAEGADNNAFSYCYIHNFGDVGMTILDSNGWLIEHSRLDRLGQVGTISAQCGGGTNHGAGIVLSGSTYDFTIRNNMMSNMEATGWIGIYDTGTGYVDGLYVYGNTFFNTSDYLGTWGNGIVYNVSGTTQPVKNIQIYNNTFANLNSSMIVGLTKDIGQSRYIAGSQGNLFYNNIIYNVKGTPGYTIYNKGYNSSDKPIAGDNNIQLLTSNPFVDDSQYDFHLARPLLSGIKINASGSITDMDGIVRGGSDANADRGAFEFVSSTQVSEPSPAPSPAPTPLPALVPASPRNIFVR